MDKQRQPILAVVYLLVRDMDASVGFYERLGLTITRVGDSHARAEWAQGARIEFGTAELTRSYDPNFREPSGASPNALNVHLAKRHPPNRVKGEAQCLTNKATASNRLRRAIAP